MARTPITATALSTQDQTVNYPIWLAQEQHDNVRRSFEAANQDWAVWSADALARLLREDADEIKSLVGGRSKRDGKIVLPCRIRKDVVDMARKVAKENKSTIQAVFAAAFYMHAMAPKL